MTKTPERSKRGRGEEDYKERKTRRDEEKETTRVKRGWRELTICHQHTSFRESLISQPNRIRMNVDPIDNDSPERSLELRSDLRAHHLISDDHDLFHNLLLFLLIGFRRLSGGKR